MLRHALFIFTWTLIAVSAGCTDDGFGDDLPDGANTLVVDRTATGKLDVASGDAVDWYRLELDRGGTISVSVSFVAPANVVGARVNIYNDVGLGVTAVEDEPGLFTRQLVLDSERAHVLEIEVGISAGVSNYSISAGVSE